MTPESPSPLLDMPLHLSLIYLTRIGLGKSGFRKFKFYKIRFKGIDFLSGRIENYEGEESKLILTANDLKCQKT